MKNISKPLKKDFVSTYDMIVQEGIEKGIEKGIAKGIEEGRQQGAMKEKLQVVLNGYKSGIEISMLANLTQLTEKEVGKMLRDNGVNL